MNISIDTTGMDFTPVIQGLKHFSIELAILFIIFGVPMIIFTLYYVRKYRW